jgi:hypothetical protein
MVVLGKNNQFIEEFYTTLLQEAERHEGCLSCVGLGLAFFLLCPLLP